MVVVESLTQTTPPSPVSVTMGCVGEGEATRAADGLPGDGHSGALPDTARGAEDGGRPEPRDEKRNAQNFMQLEC